MNTCEKIKEDIETFLNAYKLTSTSKPDWLIRDLLLYIGTALGYKRDKWGQILVNYGYDFQLKGTSKAAPLKKPRKVRSDKGVKRK